MLEVARLRVGAADVHRTDVQLRVDGCRQAGDLRSSCTGIARRIIASTPLIRNCICWLSSLPSK